METKRGAQLGNSNATKTRLWSLAIQKALRKRSNSEQLEELEGIAEVLLDKCREGDMSALKELGDRIEGKPAQVIIGDDENPLHVVQRIERVIVRE